MAYRKEACITAEDGSAIYAEAIYPERYTIRGRHRYLTSKGRRYKRLKSAVLHNISYIYPAGIFSDTFKKENYPLGTVCDKAIYPKRYRIRGGRRYLISKGRRYKRFKSAVLHNISYIYLAGIFSDTFKKEYYPLGTVYDEAIYPKRYTIRGRHSDTFKKEYCPLGTVYAEAIYPKRYTICDRRCCLTSKGRRKKASKPLYCTVYHAGIFSDPFKKEYYPLGTIYAEAIYPKRYTIRSRHSDTVKKEYYPLGTVYAEAIYPKRYTGAGMGVQAGSSKRKLGDPAGPAMKLSRTEVWPEEQYSPAGRNYQYPSVYSAPTEYHSRYPVQQTICCDNGKSYLDLGSWNGNSSKCCEGRTNWCSHGPACYRQKRLTVLNISMCKLSRYRQFSDPSLHKSVLICNTLRLIEREMEQEGYFNIGTTPPEPIKPIPEVPTYEPPRSVTPFPNNVTESDSGLGDERTINWGSVLSLSNQSDLDPMNNNDSIGDGMEFGSEMDELFPPWKLSSEDMFSSPRASEEVDSLMHVLVNT
ncbi:hypothetical protein AAG570_008243 [Ranatra chinensis]|uniref:SERTA domain-containing protein n=1 Tax=Ranatra chinensis TaxID=642074 RepID=A0ABD0XSK3_9HEMI